jgi:hypothetical protein
LLNVLSLSPPATGYYVTISMEMSHLEKLSVAQPLKNFKSFYKIVFIKAHL